MGIKSVSQLLGSGIVLGLLGHAYSRPPEVIEAPAKPEPTLEQLLQEVPPKYGISPYVAAAMVRQESGGKSDAVRYEPSQIERARKVAKSSNPDTIREYASSHGLLQVMGYHAPKYGLTWAQLHDPATNFEVGMAILADCAKHSKTGTKFDQMHSALACYNGSQAYADQVMSRIGRVLIEAKL